MTHAMLIHQYFVSPNEAGGTRHFELGMRFVGSGHRFTIVASNVNHQTGKAVSADRTSNYDGVQVVRAPSYAPKRRNLPLRIVSFLSFMISSVWVGWRVRNVDVIMGTSPPLFQSASAWILSILKWKPLLIEVRDLWPEFAIDMGLLKNPVVIWLARRWESFIYWQATHLLVNSPAYRDYLIAKGVSPSKISFIANGVDSELFGKSESDDALRAELGLQDKFVVTYAGALGIANDLDVILDAAKLLSDDTRIHFLMVGDGPERQRLELRRDELGLKNVTFTGSRPKSEMPNFLAASNACLATLMDIPMFRTTYPNKVFDYMASGRPTVLAIDGVIRQVLDAAHGGVFAQPGRPDELVKAVRILAEDPKAALKMGESARDYVRTHFNRNKQAAEFQQLMCQVGERRAA